MIFFFHILTYCCQYLILASTCEDIYLFLYLLCILLWLTHVKHCSVSYSYQRYHALGNYGMYLMLLISHISHLYLTFQTN